MGDGATATIAMEEVPMRMFVLPMEMGVAVAGAGMAMEELPMKMAEGPREMGVLSMVRGAAPGRRVVPAMARPSAMAVIVWPPRVMIADPSGWNWPPAFMDCDGGLAGFDAGGLTVLPPAPCCRWKVGVDEGDGEWPPPLLVLIGWRFSGGLMLPAGWLSAGLSALMSLLAGWLPAG